MRAALAVAAVAAISLASCAPNPEVFESRDASPATATELSTPSATEVTSTAAPETSAPAEEVTGPPAAVECRSIVEEMPVADQVGQLFMVGVDTGGLDETTRSAISNGRIGSVVLLGNHTAGAAPIRTLTAQLGSLGSASAPLLVAVDQEGGTVQRLKGDGFSDIPPAREQGSWAEGELRESARLWADELRAVGVHYDLAPVGDVVPEAKRESNEPIGRLSRDFGSDPAAAAASAVEFIEGMQEGRIATSIKHFPGLGEVTTNTDFGAAEDTVTDRSSLGPFEAAIGVGVDSVMVSSARFTKLDPDNEGVFSEAIMTELLRDELGFQGVVIADDLGAAASVRDVTPADRAIRFFTAGGDLLINADPRIMGQMAQAAVAEASDDRDFAMRVVDSAERVLRLKASVGLLDCQ